MIQENKNNFKILNMLLRIAVLFVIIEQFRLHNYESAVLALITLLVFMIPVLVRKKIQVPDIIESMVLVSVYGSVILGEINYYYVMLPFYDSALHALNGFILAAVGYSIIDFLNHGRKLTVLLSPAFTIVYIICFAAAAGVLWELFEYFGDSVFGRDMQKDAFIDQINSILLNTEISNEPVSVSLDSVVINGQQWPGYIDIGLNDTMKDMFLNLAGAIVFAVYFFIRNKKSGSENLQELLPQFKKEKN